MHDSWQIRLDLHLQSHCYEMLDWTKMWTNAGVWPYQEDGRLEEMPQQSVSPSKEILSIDDSTCRVVAIIRVTSH